MRYQWMNVAVLAVLAAVVGCNSEPDPTMDVDTGFDVSEPQPDTAQPDTAQPDTAQPDADSPDTTQPIDHELEIFLDNQSQVSIFAQIASHSVFSNAWFTIRDSDDNRLELSSTCMPCPCESPDNCPVCDAPMPRAEELEPGDRLSYTWNGTYYTVVTENGRQCTRTNHIGTAHVDVTVCWGESLTGGDDEFANYVVDPTCVTAGHLFGTQESTGVTVEN